MSLSTRPSAPIFENLASISPMSPPSFSTSWGRNSSGTSSRAGIPALGPWHLESSWRGGFCGLLALGGAVLQRKGAIQPLGEGRTAQYCMRPDWNSFGNRPWGLGPTGLSASLHSFIGTMVCACTTYRHGSTPDHSWCRPEGRRTRDGVAKFKEQSLLPVGSLLSHLAHALRHNRRHLRACVESTRPKVVWTTSAHAKTTSRCVAGLRLKFPLRRTIFGPRRRNYYYFSGLKRSSAYKT